MSRTWRVHTGGCTVTVGSVVDHRRSPSAGDGTGHMPAQDRPHRGHRPVDLGVGHQQGGSEPEDVGSGGR